MRLNDGETGVTVKVDEFEHLELLYISGTVQVEHYGDKVGEARLKREGDYTKQKMMEMKGKRQITVDIHGCSVKGCAGVVTFTFQNQHFFKNGLL